MGEGFWRYGSSKRGEARVDEALKRKKKSTIKPLGGGAMKGRSSRGSEKKKGR